AVCMERVGPAMRVRGPALHRAMDRRAPEMDGGALALRRSGRARREELMQADARARRDDFLAKIGSRAIVMGILNVTPDSFSDGGRFVNLDAALAQAKRMVAGGGDIRDVGRQSNRARAAPVQ